MTGQYPPQNETLQQPQVAIADSRAVTTLNELAAPMERSSISVATIVVLDVLSAVGLTSEAIIRCPELEVNFQVQLASSDQETSLLVRLLEMKLKTNYLQPRTNIAVNPIMIELRGVGEGQLAWFLGFTGTSIFLSSSKEQTSQSGGTTLMDIATRAGKMLQYLAEPGMSSRWTEPLPRDFGTMQQRWRVRLEQETVAAAHLLAHWLRLEDLPAEGAPPEGWWKQLGFSMETHPMLAIWSQWLRSQEILNADENLLRIGKRYRSVARSEAAAAGWEQPVKNLFGVLTERNELINRVLTGEVVAAELLKIPELRPARLAASEPDLIPVWQQICDLLEDKVSQVSGLLRLADLGGASRENPYLGNFLQEAKITTIELQAGRPTNKEASFDVVLAVGSLHQWADPEAAVQLASSLLRPDGLLLAVENTELSPLGLLVAGLLENGFTDVAGKPRSTPTQSEETWLRLLRSVGMQSTSIPVGPTPAVLIQAQQTEVHSQQPETPDKSHELAGKIRLGTETYIASLWGQLLQRAPKRRSESFFELGGDSLRATQFIAAVRQRYSITITMRELFAQPQLAAVAQRIDSAISESGYDTHEEGAL